MAHRYSEELDMLFIDRTVYDHAWRTFISASLQEWKESFIYTSLSFLLHFIFVFAPGSSILTMTSLLLFTGSVTASSLLMKYYQPLEKCQLGAAHEHIQSVQSNKNQFLLVALTYSLPSALHLWGSALSSSTVSLASSPTSDSYRHRIVLFCFDCLPVFLCRLLQHSHPVSSVLLISQGKNRRGSSLELLCIPANTHHLVYILPTSSAQLWK
ncbi:hypothetical protein CPB85DRAFT_282309 [Mucidula mucida]|nr:hypothetical protein CPB85DRAFT_282309 [Mucidula mucida]